MEIFMSRAPPRTVSIADYIARTPAKRKPGPCGPGLVRRRGGVDDSPSRGEHLPTLRSPIWEDEATACLQHDQSMRVAMRAHNAGGDMTAMRPSQGYKCAHNRSVNARCRWHITCCEDCASRCRDSATFS